MMPITPMGVAMREMSRPLGRVQRESSRPTGSGRAATSSTPLAIASMRFSSSARRSSIETLRPFALAFARSSALAARISFMRARSALAAACNALFLVSVEASRMARAAARAAWPSARISLASASLLSARRFMCPSPPDRRDGSSRRGHDSQNGLDFDAALARDALGIGGAISRKSAGDFVTLTIAYHHRIAAFEAAVDLADAGGQKAFAFLQRAHSACVDDERAV